MRNTIEKAKKATKKSETKFFTLKEVCEGFLALRYGCAIISVEKSPLHPSFMLYMADGIPFLKFRELGNGFNGKYYNVLMLGGVECPPDCTIVYSLHEIKDAFVKILSGKKFAPKLNNKGMTIKTKSK